jgi:tetratricopeptide (TPR) repeat protein
VEGLHRQARESLESGDVQGARECWQAALKLNPEDSTAIQGLASTGGSEAAEADAISLDLDLSLESPSPDDPAGLAEPRVASRSPAVTTLEVEPVEDDDVDPAGPGPAAAGAARRLSTPETEGGEATLLVSRARQALASGRLDEAMDLASRALVLSEGMPSAQLVLDGARAEAGRRAGEVERMLTDAIAVFESGGVQESVRLFERVLELLPDHAEARDYLSRAQAALAASADDAAQDLEDVESIPLEAPPPVEENQDDVGEVGAAEAFDPDESLTGRPISRAQRSAEPGAEGLPLRPPTAIAARAGVGASSVRPAVRAAGAGSRGMWIALALTLAAAALLAAVWFVPGILGAGEAGRSRQTEATPEEPAATTPDDAGNRESRPEPASESSGQSAERSTQAAEPPAPRYTRADVPALLVGARESLEAGDEQLAVELLRAAQIADPANMEVIERLDRAQKALSERTIARERVEQGQRAFVEGQYAEALRVFYRIPEAYRPEALERWIAAGWYNLGVQSLQAGSPTESIQFFTDALNLVPGDPEAVRHREVAQRYRTRPMDDAYRIYVGSLQMRPLPR